MVKFKYGKPETAVNDAMLDSIIITSPDGEERIIRFRYSGKLLTKVIDQNETVYSFDYYFENGNTPYFDYSEQDFGGYPNGSNRSGLVPTIVQGCGQIGGGGDRSVNPATATEASLRRITYATGGFTQFEWESNSFSHLNSLEYTGRINNDQITHVVTDTIRACRETGYEKLKINEWRLSQGQIVKLDMTKYFNMNPANLFGSAYHDGHTSDMYPVANPPRYPHIIIRNHTTSRIEKVYFLDKNTIEPDGVKKVIQLSLVPGVYDFELKFPYDVQGAEDFIETEFRYHDGNCGYIFLTKISTDHLTAIGNQNWCGLRIKRMISCAGDGENDTLRKDFYYNLVKDPYSSSGTVQLLPAYDYAYYKNYPSPNTPGYESSDVYCVGDIPFPNLPNGSFSNIVYPEVSVSMGKEDRMEPDGYLNDYTESYVYSSTRDESLRDYNHTQFESCQPVGSRMYTSKRHWVGNLVQSIKHLRSARNHVTSYAYNIYEDAASPTLTTDAFPICDFTSVPGENSYGQYDYGIGTYQLIQYNKTLSYEGVTQEDGLNTFKKYDYFYGQYTDSLDWSLVKSLTSSDSEHGQCVTYYTYAKKGSRFFPYPETEITVVGDDIISAIRTEYDENSFLPICKYTLSTETTASTLIALGKQTTPAQLDRIDILTYAYKYDDRGNIIQVSYKGKPLVSYIWGYNGLYPILEATDVDHATLVNAAMTIGLSKDVIDGNLISAESTIHSAANRLRQQLPHSSITAISYHWLFGIAKLTNPQGVSTRYGYDSRGRLKEVRDFNNYIINKYDYHYEKDFER